MTWCKKKGMYVSDVRCCLCKVRCDGWVGINETLMKEVTRLTDFVLEIKPVFRRKFNKFLIASPNMLVFTDKCKDDSGYVFQTYYLFSVKFSFVSRTMESDAPFYLVAGRSKFLKGSYFVALYDDMLPVAIFRNTCLSKLLDSNIKHIVTADLFR